MSSGRPRPNPHPLNVVGDFFVEDGCCTRCGVPDFIAPDLFDASNEACWVKKQPTSPDEIKRMIEVVRSAELDCIYYQGSDPSIIGAIEQTQTVPPKSGAGGPRDWLRRLFKRRPH